ncbi:hypothetical protein O6H91_06G088200 [Diphasiastrum complanatum]|uniref:Uncharacterized protein n=1 Tax=Diphasiastrum complanatum TaxID=34168 RepID=A0ACC2DGC7_DIPCM|nr:hypothetical protein O6H91_06G088200 [Diphasiastrum complanatum]
MAGCRQGAVPRLFGCSWEPHNKSGFVHTHVGFVQRWRLGGASQSSDATPLLVSKIVGSSRSGSVTHRNFVVMAAAAAAESNQDNLPAVSNVVTVRHADLLNKSSDLAAVLEEGFGPSGLGIIAISGVPKFSELRKKLLKLSQSLSALPEEAKLQLEDPISKYSFGWSYGKEILDSGQPDSLKGSFYANPLYDVPTLDAKLIQRYPAHCRPNLWPTKHLPELEPTFKMLGALMVEVGLLIANHCDKYILLVKGRIN